LFTYYPGMSGLHPMVAARTVGRSHTITAEVDRTDPSQAGVLLAIGGRFAGWTFYVQRNRLVYEHNYVGLERYVITSDTEVPIGPCALGMRFERTDRLAGNVTLLIDGAEVGKGEVAKTCLITGFEPLDCGQDTQTPVSPAYDSPFRFTGTLKKVVLEVFGRGIFDDRAETTAALAEQ
jgi:arylsulfatase